MLKHDIMNADVQMSHMGFHSGMVLQKQLAALWQLILPLSLALSLFHFRDLCIYFETIKDISTRPSLQPPHKTPRQTGFLQHF